MGLASIQIITGFRDIKDKDEIKEVLFSNTNWTVIMNVIKDGSKVGDKVVYFEVNSLLPIKEEYEFLRSRCFSSSWNGFVIKPMKMGGQVSMGLALNVKDIKVDLSKCKAGTDVTEKLEVIKYDPELRKETSESKKYNKFQIFLLKNKFTSKFFRWYFIGRKQVKKTPYLTFVSKAGETNIQDFDEKILRRDLKDFYVTEKIEGKNALFAVERIGKKLEFIYCSHNVVFRDGQGNKNGSDILRFVKENKIDEKMIRFMKEHTDFKTIAISGELCGPSIQGNIYDFKELRFFMFDVFLNGELEDEKWQDYYAMTFGVERVPVLFTETLPFDDRSYSVDYWKSMATGSSIIGSKPKLREGIVVRNRDQKFGFKSKSPEYSLWFLKKSEE